MQQWVEFLIDKISKKHFIRNLQYSKSRNMKILCPYDLTMARHLENYVRKTCSKPWVFTVLIPVSGKGFGNILNDYCKGDAEIHITKFISSFSQINQQHGSKHLSIPCSKTGTVVLSSLRLTWEQQSEFDRISSLGRWVTDIEYQWPYVPCSHSRTNATTIAMVRVMGLDLSDKQSFKRNIGNVVHLERVADKKGLYFYNETYEAKRCVQQNVLPIIW